MQTRRSTPLADSATGVGSNRPVCPESVGSNRPVCPESVGSNRPAAVRRSQTRVDRCAKRATTGRVRDAWVFSGEIAINSVILVDLPFCFGTAEEEGKAEWAQWDPSGGWDDDGWFACRFGCRSERRGAKRIAVPLGIAMCVASRRTRRQAKHRVQFHTPSNRVHHRGLGHNGLGK